MPKALTGPAILALPLALLALSPSATAATHPFSVRDMLAMDRISEPAPSPDGTLVAFTLRTTDLEANRGRTDVWLLDVATKGIRRLTTHEAGDSSPKWARDGKSLYFLSTRSGSAQVWKLSLAGGEPEPVTKEPLDLEGFDLSPDGKFLLLGMAVLPGKSPAETKAALDEKGKSKASGMLYDRLFVRHWDTWKDGTRNHLFSFRLPAGPAVDLMKEMDADCPTKPFGGMEDAAVSPDGTTVVFSAKDAGREEAWSTNYDLFIAPADGSAPPRKLTTNPAWDAQPRFSPDGRTLGYLAMRRAGYEADQLRLVLRELSTAKERTIELRAGDGPRDDRSFSEWLFSADGRTVLATADHLGQHPLFQVDLATGKARILAGEGTVVSPQNLPGGRVLYGMHSLLGPTELYSVAVSGKPEKLTSVNESKLDAARLGAPQPFSFKGAKGDTVHGWLVKPADFDPAKRYPVAFLVHGGPQGSFGNDFHYRWNPQAYAGAGYAAVMVDFHGSTGYGQAFTDAINGDWGGAPYEDLMKGLDHALATFPFLDGTRVAALGASYGGYMINWLAGQTDRFRCLVVHDGNLDERMAYYDTEELWFPEWEHGGLPWDAKTTYDKHNPIDFVGKWKTPTLVVHGQKDFRVVYTQGLSVFTALQRKGIPSKLLIFPDENHWVLKPANSILWHETVLGWLDQWTKK